MNLKLPLGLDVSHWEGFINWATVTPKPLFVYCKATEGNYYQDETFKPNMVGLLANGIHRGAFHFHRKLNTPESQAKHFCDFVRGTLLLDDYIVLDVEEGGENAAQLKTWFEAVRVQFPHNPFAIYSRKNILDTLIMTEAQRFFFKQIPVFTAGYPASPDLFTSPPSGYIPDQTKFGRVYVWQYSEHGHVVGINEEVDLDWLSPEFIKILNEDEPAPADVITYPHDGMKLISGTRNGWKFRLMITDPAKVRYELVSTPLLETVSSVVVRKGAVFGCNAGEWNDRDKTLPSYLKPVDYTVASRKEIVARDETAARPTLQFTYDTVVISHRTTSYFVENAFTGLRYIVGPLAKPSEWSTEGHARACFGIHTNGDVMILLSEGVYPNQGLKLSEAKQLLEQYGAVVAFDGGGGGDAGGVLDGVDLIKPENIAGGVNVYRRLPMTFLIYVNGEQPNMTTYTVKARADATKVYKNSDGTMQIASLNVADIARADSVAAFVHLYLKNGLPLSGYVDPSKVIYTADTVTPPPPPPPPATRKVTGMDIALAAGSVVTRKYSDGTTESETA